jgi:hypothetical protein
MESNGESNKKPNKKSVSDVKINHDSEKNIEDERDFPESKTVDIANVQESCKKSNRKSTPEIEIEIDLEKEIELKDKKTIGVQLSERIKNYTSDEKLILALEQFIKHRKSRRKPIESLYALNLLLTELDKHSDKLAVVNQSIANCWQGFFELKTNSNARKEEETGNIFRQIGREEGLW